MFVITFSATKIQRTHLRAPWTVEASICIIKAMIASFPVVIAITQKVVKIQSQNWLVDMLSGFVASKSARCCPRPNLTERLRVMLDVRASSCD